MAFHNPSLPSARYGAKLFGKNSCSSEGSAVMWEKFKQTWQRIKAGKAGQRFQQEFRRRHGAGRSPIRKALLIGGGLLFMAAGFVLLFIPGPGLVFLFVGAFLIAQQSLLAARALDWSELRLKKLLAWSLGSGAASRQP